MTKKHIGTCCICGREGKLTFEHIPPHKASNGFPLKLYNVGKYITENNARYSSLQNGAGAWTLCSSCNNLTGAWYGNAYVEFASQGITYYRKKAAGIISVPYTIRILFCKCEWSELVQRKSSNSGFSPKPKEQKFS